MWNKFGLKLLLLFLVPALVYAGWQRWVATSPQPLPQKAIGPAREDLLPGTYYTLSIPMQGPMQGKDQVAAYRLWIPQGTQKIRGLLVKQHGCGESSSATGLNHANDLQWQALTAKHQFAILGTHLPIDYPACTDETIKDREAERAFLSALTALAAQSSHPELVHVPWALWGHSGGADWAMQLLYRYPERVIAVVNTRCGGIEYASGKSELAALEPKSALKLLGVPVLWALGDRDLYADECVALPKQIFSTFRQAGAIWAIAIEANAGHESSDTRLLAIPYLDAVLRLRLTDDSPNLRSIPAAQGWLGNPATHEIAPAAQYRGNALVAAWLPNRETAEQWQHYMTSNPLAKLAQKLGAKGVVNLEPLFSFAGFSQNLSPSQIAPTHPPEAPIHLQISRSKTGQNWLVWGFVPDLANGVPSFRIYRDHRLIKTLRGPQHNADDAPEPPQIVLEFEDTQATGRSVYKVAAFNVRGETSSPAVGVDPISPF